MAHINEEVATACPDTFSDDCGQRQPTDRKQYLDDDYRARTIRHSNAVLRDFYAYWIDVGEGPLLNPVRIDHRSPERPNAGHNPLQPFRAREPTEQEWTEFRQHFHERKLELGTCGRPYGTPCKHEHACVGCPMLRVDARQRGRIIEIIANLTERIKAELNGRLAEVAGLKTSREAAVKKLTNLDRAAATAAQSPAEKAELGIPMPRNPLRR